MPVRTLRSPKPLIPLPWRSSLSLLLIGLFSCRTSNPSPPSSQPSPASPSTLPALLTNLPPAQPDRSQFPITVQNCGRSLTFQQPPQRVISLWQPANELLLSLGLQQQLIGLAGNYTTLPPSLAAAAQPIPILGTGTRWPGREVMLSQKPDLVISEGLEGFAFDPAQGYATVKELEQAGAQVFSTGSSCTLQQAQTRGITAVTEDLRSLGQIFGVSNRATQLIQRFQQQQAAITQRVRDRQPVRTLFYNGGEGPINVLTTGVWADTIRQAGGQSVFPPTVFQVSIEEVAVSGAEVILIGYYPGQDPQPLIAFLQKTFPDLPAVKTARLHPIPTIDTEAGIRILDGLAAIARALHPAAF